jgi:hypothetical protein
MHYAGPSCTKLQSAGFNAPILWITETSSEIFVKWEGGGGMAILWKKIATIFVYYSLYVCVDLNHISTYFCTLLKIFESKLSLNF